MRVGKKHYRTVWLKGRSVFFIDQNQLPFKFKISRADSYQATCQAIKTMAIRGAGAIGAAAGFAMAQAILRRVDAAQAKRVIKKARPTAQNLFYAVNRVFQFAEDPKKAVAEHFSVKRV